MDVIARPTSGPLAAAALLVALAVALLAPTPAAAGQFGIRCQFSHRLTDDPIVHPGHPGASHLHDFFGAVTAAANSTYASMKRSQSTCSDNTDTAGYWHPRMYIDGQGMTATVTAWYSKGGKPTVDPFPRSIKLLAGYPMATHETPLRELYWRCAGPGRHVRVRYLPHCGARQELTANLVFPDCWDGTHLDSADHRSHATYSRNHACPSTHPVPLPQLTLVVRWHAHPRRRSVSFSSGGFMTMHADFWNTWHQARLRSLIDQCVNTNIDCGVIRRHVRR